MNIDILCTDGSPLGVSSQSIFGEDGRLGVGGAELALLTMCEEWTKAGHRVILFNNPRPGSSSPFEQRKVDDFWPLDESRDVLIVFRSPNHRILRAVGKKVWWSCDQQTIGDFAQFSRIVDQIVCISPFHAGYFATRYGIKHTTVIDLPVRVEEYLQRWEQVSKVHRRCLFSSVPDRGLNLMNRVWRRVVKAVPDASLVITSDYRLWGCPDPRNEQFRALWGLLPNVTFLGGINRTRLIEEQLKAEVLSYPCIYDELFCIAVAEAQVAGAMPVTSSQGALSTTNMGIKLPGEAQGPNYWREFGDRLIEVLLDSSRHPASDRLQLQSIATQRFKPETILKQWNEKVFNT